MAVGRWTGKNSQNFGTCFEITISLQQVISRGGWAGQDRYNRISKYLGMLCTDSACRWARISLCGYVGHTEGF